MRNTPTYRVVGANFSWTPHLTIWMRQADAHTSTIAKSVACNVRCRVASCGPAVSAQTASLRHSSCRCSMVVSGCDFGVAAGMPRCLPGAAAVAAWRRLPLSDKQTYCVGVMRVLLRLIPPPPHADSCLHLSM